MKGFTDAFIMILAISSNLIITVTSTFENPLYTAISEVLVRGVWTMMAYFAFQHVWQFVSSYKTR